MKRKKLILYSKSNKFKFHLGYTISTILVLVLIFEIITFTLVHFNLLPVSDTPKIYKSIYKNGNNLESNWYTEKDSWGVWHQRNSFARHSKSCFKATYNSNSIGARDTEFKEKLSPTNTAVLLGDSFAEGYGVNFTDTAQFKIESITKKTVLNFGSSGSMGPLQYWIIYRDIATKYPHDSVLIFFFPRNDFTDNDFTFWEKTKLAYIDGHSGDYRYRPYYLKIKDGVFDSFIPNGAKKRLNFENNIRNSLGNLRIFFRDYFWSANLYRSLNFVRWNYFQSKSFINAQSNYSGYFDPTMEQQESAVFFIKKIIESNKNKKYYLFSIPTPEDYQRISRGGGNPSSMLWWNELKKLENSGLKNFTFIDLVDFYPQNIENLYLSCDGHWNSHGNEITAKIIAKIIK